MISKVLDKSIGIWYNTRMENQNITRIALVLLLALSIISVFNLAISVFSKEDKIIVQQISETESLVIEELSYTEEDHLCMALNLYHEARNELDAGLYAVADVTQNRVNDPRWPNTVCDVVYESKTYMGSDGEQYPRRNRCQFSWYCDGRSDDPRPGQAWEKSKYIARMFLTHDEFRGITEGATHYHATYVNPRWATAKGMHMVGQIGEHIFYRWK
jgi:N-acetylmuramoyl-L-alanine amidase